MLKLLAGCCSVILDAPSPTADAWELPTCRHMQIWRLSHGIWILRDSSGQAQLLSCTSAAAASEFGRLVEPQLEQHRAAQQQQAERLQHTEAAQQVGTAHACSGHSSHRMAWPHLTCSALRSGAAS